MFLEFAIVAVATKVCKEFDASVKRRVRGGGSVPFSGNLARIEG